MKAVLIKKATNGFVVETNPHRYGLEEQSSLSIFPTKEALISHISHLVDQLLADNQ